MNKYVLTLMSVLLFGSSFAFAKALNRLDTARKIQDKVSKSVFKIDGVNGIGITGCHPRTGKISTSKGDYVYCVVINTEDEEAYEEVMERYPRGTQINGIFIVVRKIGVIKPEPAATGGN